jgi:hypothetical protein
MKNRTDVNIYFLQKISGFTGVLKPSLAYQSEGGSADLRQFPDLIESLIDRLALPS